MLCPCKNFSMESVVSQVYFYPSMEQGRLATAHMFGAPMRHQAYQLPYGIYTIPEIAMIGQTEEQLTAASIPYETGVARYEELAKAEMLGDRTGMLKRCFTQRHLTFLASTLSGNARRR